MHIVEAIIAKEEITKEIDCRLIFAKSIPLTQGYAMVPITDRFKDDMDDLGIKGNLFSDYFEKLSYSINEVILDTALPYEIAYIETEYFGGEGQQSAIVWKDGKIIFGPKTSDEERQPINEALKIIGVRIINKQDEFDEMKLGWKRDTEKWYRSGS